MMARSRMARLSPIVAGVAVAVLGFMAAREIASADWFGAFLIAVVAFSVLALLNPRMGLYGFCFTLVLVPFEWRADGLKFTSPSVILIGVAVISLAVSVVSRSAKLKISDLYVPLGVAAFVTWMNYIRYGSPFFNTPYILTESLVLLLLGFHLIRTRAHLGQLLAAIATAVLVRNAIDIGLTVASFNAGDSLGAIRQDGLLWGTAATTESEWRSLLLPLFLAGVLMSPNRGLRVLMTLALVSDVAWLSLSATRTAMIGMVVAPVALMFVLPSSRRLTLVGLTIPVAIVAVFLTASYSESWNHILSKSAQDLQGGWESGRLSLWGLV